MKLVTLSIFTIVILGISSPAWSLCFGLNKPSGQDAVHIILDFVSRHDMGSLMTDKLTTDGITLNEYISSIIAQYGRNWTRTQLRGILEDVTDTISAMANEAFTYSLTGLQDPLLMDDLSGKTKTPAAPRKVLYENVTGGNTVIPAVPEPATLFLMGSGLLWIGSIRRKKQY